MSEVNIHIKQYLDYYYSLEYPPEYAVLLKGKWGVGKTWFIKQTIKEKSSSNYKFLYVSLYGISTFEEIETDFYKQLHPLLSSKSLDLVGKIAKGLLKATIKVDLDGDGKSDGSVSAQAPDIDLPDYLTNTDEYILIFDDIERCSISIGNLLGYINHFVEHQGRKVILIANEEEIIKYEKEKYNEYLKIKEKLIGKELEIKSDFYGAIDHFISRNDDKDLKKVYRDNMDEIYALFNKSGYENLRYLRISLLDFKRLFDQISDESRKKKGLVSHLLKIYLCYSFEIKSGSLTPKDLDYKEPEPFTGFLDTVGKRENEKTPYDLIIEKYKNLSLSETLLKKSQWVDIFDKGLINRDLIEKSLLKSSYYHDTNIPCWENLWNYYYLSDEQFDQNYKVVKKKFCQMHYKEVGVLTHVVGVLLKLSDLQLVDMNKKTILDHAKLYVGVLKKKKLLNTQNLIDGTNLDRENSWNGLVFIGRDLPEFKEFMSHLNEETNKVIINSYSCIADDLLKLMKNNTDKFYRRITANNHKDNLYYNIPILSYIDPNAFVQQFMGLKPPQRLEVFYALINRYEMPTTTLSSELAWLMEVKDLLESHQKSLIGKVSGFQLKQLINEELMKAIELLGKRSITEKIY